MHKPFLKNNYDVIILVGGKGSRIKKFLKSNPKPLVKINSKPFITYLLNHIKKFNIRNIYLMTGYKSDKFFKKYHKREINLINIKCIRENKPMGTAGCLYKIKSKVSENFFIINGDTFFDINLNKMYELKKKNKYVMASTFSKNYKSNKQLNKLSINKQDYIVYKDSKGKIMNGGCYLFDKSIFKKIKNKYQSLEILVEDFIKKKKFIGYKSKNLFIDIGTPGNLKKSKKIFPDYFNKPALFLDRDGTINEDNGYVHKVKDLVFKSKTLKLIKKFINKDYWIFIVTNQAGVAKKKFSIEDFKIFQKNLKYELSKKNILINDTRYCLYHKNAKIISLKKNSNYRKPGNLMIKNLLNEWDVNLSKSLMIGDQKSDEQCAKNSNIDFYFTKDINKIKY